MPKVSLSDVASGYNVATRINANNDLIEAGFENTLSRDGSTPNQMNAALDMNSNRVINVGSPVSDTDAARWVDVTDAIAISTTLPSQTGNSGKYVTTDGTSLSWQYPVGYFAQTAEESAASVTPLDYYKEPGDIRRYGAVKNSTVGADMTATTLAWANALKTGHPVYIPEGTWNVNSTTTILVGVGNGWTRKVTGAGKNTAVLKANGAGVTVLKVESDLPVLLFSDFSMQGATGTGHGLWCTLTAFQCEFRNMWIKMGGKAFYFPNTAGSFGHSFSLNFHNVDFSSFDDHGIEVAGGPATNFFGCYGHDFPAGKAAWRVYRAANFYGCNGVDTADYWIIAGQTTSGGLDAQNTTYGVHFDGCNFENYAVMAFDGRYAGSNVFRSCAFVPKGTGTYTTAVNSDQFNYAIFDDCVWVPLNGASGAGNDWQANTAYIVGARVENNDHQLICVTAGVSGGAFSSGTGAGQTDGTVVWDYSSVGVNRSAASEVTCDLNTSNVLFHNCEAALGTMPKVYLGGFQRTTASMYVDQIAFLTDGHVFTNARVGMLLQGAQIATTRTTLTYSASININAALGNSFIVTATNGTAFTINNPTNGIAGQQLTITISNTSGGALGVVSWSGAFKLATWTSPATGFKRSITFEYDGTYWCEVGRTAADIPN